ncbi:hypothetical protein ACNVED_03785 [Legionella sp. D16C41]|uniref:hypothetical protein n=1 Tax=Legionella sp. D16C41 TaxID=3402688 RepID=UPI003AF69719
MPEEKTILSSQTALNKTTLLDVPKDVIGVLASNYLSLQSIFSLRLTSKKFGLDDELNNIMNNKRLAIAVHAFGSFYLWRGKVFAVGRPYSGLKETIEQIPIPGNVSIRTIHVGSEYAIFSDGKNNYFEFGKHLSLTALPTYAEQIRKLQLKDSIITKVVTGDYNYFMCDNNGKWHSSGPHQASLDYLQEQGKNITHIVSKDKHTCLRDNDGRWYGFGKGEFFGAEEEVYEPVLITLPNEEAILDVKLGKENTFLKGSSGRWFAYGQNSRNQLGASDIVSQYSIFEYKTLDNLPIEKLIVGDYHVFACDKQNQWYFSGAYIRYQANDTRRPVTRAWEYSKIFHPINLPNSNKIINIITATSHTFYLDNQGRWYAGGPNISHDLIGFKESYLTLEPKEFNFFELANIADSETPESYNSLRR